MSLKRPAVELTLDGRSLDAAESALLSVQVELSVGGGHDRFVCGLGLLSPFSSVAPGVDAELKLGYGDELEAVLAGTVSAVERAPWGLLVEGLAGTATLSTTRLGRSYVDQTAADIVSDLVSAAGVSTGEVSAPRHLSAYHVDERRSIWTHVCQLARLTGSELTSDPQGALNFRPVKTGAADHGLRRGADLLAWNVGPRDATAAGPSVVPYGAASEEGAEKWHIILREPEGSSPDGTVLVPAALRDRDGADALGRALADAAARSGTGGAVVAVGDGSIRAGDLVELQELPVDDLPLLRATSVTHLLGSGGGLGFRTALAVEAAA
jgi:hypothetical protein